jgi:hypothetical protein
MKSLQRNVCPPCAVLQIFENPDGRGLAHKRVTARMPLLDDFEKRGEIARVSVEVLID